MKKHKRLKETLQHSPAPGIVGGREMTDKASDLCVKYATIGLEMRRLTGLIGKLFEQCKDKQYSLGAELGIDPCYKEILKQAKDQKIYDNPDYDYDYLYTNLDCEFCEKADKPIQERRELRLRLGHVKAQITKLGLKIMREVGV